MERMYFKEVTEYGEDIFSYTEFKKVASNKGYKIISIINNKETDMVSSKKVLKSLKKDVPLDHFAQYDAGSSSFYKINRKQYSYQLKLAREAS